MEGLLKRREGFVVFEATVAHTEVFNETPYHPTKKRDASGSPHEPSSDASTALVVSMKVVEDAHADEDWPRKRSSSF